MEKTGFIIRTIVPILCLLLTMAAPAHAGEPAKNDTIMRGLLISNAFGKAFSGEANTYKNASVDFAKKVRPSNYLTPNKARMVQGSVLDDNGKRMSGTLRYADPFGRIATYTYNLGYSVLGPYRYRINKSSVKTYEPLRPEFEGYFIPAGKITLKKMRAMPTAELMQFARANGDRLQPGVEGPAKDYFVVVFCMHRLRGKAKWAVMHGDRLGSSWSKGDWHVAAIQATFGLNTKDTQLFRVLYVPDKRSPYHGKLFQMGGIVNQSVPAPTSPALSVAVPPETRQLLEKYATKHQPEAL